MKSFVLKYVERTFVKEGTEKKYNVFVVEDKEGNQYTLRPSKDDYKLLHYLASIDFLKNK